MQNWSNTALSTQTNTIVTVILTVAQVIYALPFRENMYIRTNSRRIQGKPPHAHTYIKMATSHRSQRITEHSKISAGPRQISVLT